ncbi:unnamed protein product [Mytilus edulis]|uniref:Uncharacterized protein n=1 Tax=Mytilus edulis TaxID=6550 RepID=A0A8S3T7R2_MYTED|nr:unnamed protein product [Mytilus edulis]
MELQDEKMSFDERNFSAYLNRSYSDGFSLPPDICGKQRHSDGYLHPCNRNEKGISSNHDYLSIQGSIREESQVDKVSDKPPDLPHSKYITNKEEVTELDDVRIYYEIADSTKLRTSGQSDVICFDQQEYVLRPADDYCLTQDKETNKPSANSPCSPCRMIILAAIITLLLVGIGCAAYFLLLRNTNDNEKTDTLNNTQHSITSTPTDILTNPASTLTTSTDHVLSTTKESSLSEAPSSTTETYCSPTGSTVLKLNPHQIADLEDNIHWYMHSCEANVGYPAGNLSIEILKSGELEFRKLDITTVTTEDKKTSCEIHRKIDFGIELHLIWRMQS